MKGGLVPKLRFPEFQDVGEWGETQLREIAKPVSDKAYSKDNDNVLTLSGEYGLVLQSEYFGKKIAGNNVERYIRISRNDFVYNDRTTKLSIYGSIKRLSDYESGIVSPIYKCFRFIEGENPVFWDWYFDSGSHESQLRGLVNEGARAGRFNISIDNFLSTQVWFPDPSEQQKIADCLSSIDDLITAQTKKLVTLKAHKKGLMQQLFPAEGQTLPNLRFPEFQDAGEWEENSIGNVCRTFSGGTPSTTKKEFYGGDIPFIRSAEIDKDRTELFLTSEGLTNSAAKLVDKGDLLIALYGANSGEVALAKINGAINQAILCLKSKNSNAFIYQYLALRKDDIISKYLQGGQGNLSGEIVKSINIYFPKPTERRPEEQQRIADCLTSLDSLIKAQTEKLDAIKTHKKGLMQHLFPNPELSNV